MAEVAALLAEYRRRADDQAEPYHVEDVDAIRMFAEAEREVCMRGHPIFDCTSSLTSYAIAADQVTVELAEQVLRVDYAAFLSVNGGRATKVDLTGIDAIRERCAVTSVRPFLAAHSSRRALTLYPAPSAAGTLTLDIYRLPTFDLEAEDDEPEIPLELHDGLVDWVLYRVYSTKDMELEDPARAQTALRDFTERYGERRDAEAMRRHREKRRVTTQNVL